MDTATALTVIWTAAKQVMTDAEANGLTDSYHLGRYTAAEAIINTIISTPYGPLPHPHTRTLDPLTEPEPEVREHPVTIYHGDRKVGVGRFVWHPGGASIVDVEPCKSDTLHDPLRYRASSFRYDKPWGSKLGGEPA